MEIGVACTGEGATGPDPAVAAVPFPFTAGAVVAGGGLDGSVAVVDIEVAFGLE